MRAHVLRFCKVNGIEINSARVAAKTGILLMLGAGRR